MLIDDTPDVLAKCRTSFLYFMWAMDPKFHFSPFSRKVGRELQSLYVSTQKKESPRIILEAPPQHGKSYQTAELYPAWLLGVNPNLKLVIASYSTSLVQDRNRKIQDFIDSPVYKQIFPATTLRTSRYLKDGKRDREGFDIIGFKGSARFVSIEGGSLTGYPMNIGIIDDPYRDRKKARSTQVNKDLREWYYEVFSTRTQDRHGEVLMLTRWGVGDLADHLASTGKWKQLKFKAINEQGEALVPKLHSIKHLEDKRSYFPEATFQALYQQSPIIEGGNIVKEIWLRYYSSLPLKFERIFITGDTAFTTAEASDYSVFSVWGHSENNLYMLDMWRDKVIYPDLQDAAIKLWGKWGAGIGRTPCTRFYIESVATGTAFFQELKKNTSIPVEDIARSRNKHNRLSEILVHIKNGKLHLPLNASWTKDVISELITFSEDMRHEHDDIVDTIIDALNIAFVTREVCSLEVL